MTLAIMVMIIYGTIISQTSNSSSFQWLPSLHRSMEDLRRQLKLVEKRRWNMTNSHYFELKYDKISLFWIEMDPTFTCRKFLECNTSISLDCADGWALENEIIYLYFDLSKTSVLNLVIHFFKERNQLLRNFLKPYLPRPLPAYYGINVKSNFSGVDASCQNISFNMIYLALQI